MNKIKLNLKFVWARQNVTRNLCELSVYEIYFNETL